MQPTHEPSTSENAEIDRTPVRRRIIIFLTILLAVLLLVFVPPLITFNRFQRRIATNIGASLGRPVHFDRVTLSLLPLPGFTLENFVVEEDPAFGAEPILRAAEVRATVRISSLFSPHVEFSKIAFTDPSVNLVHAATGQWNLQSILFQASHIQAAPTAQRYAGPAPRFPYVEATGARINLKLDQEKSPYSLTDTDFALWLPEPRQWHFRLEAHPVRTDSIPAETGLLGVEGTLGGSTTSLEAHAATPAQFPIDIHGTWQNAQLSGLSRLALGRDAGLRGDLTLAFNILGTVGHAAVATNIKLAQGRRADFVPPHLLSLEATCEAIANDAFHAFSAIECHWPPTDSSGPSVLIATGAVPDVRRPGLSSADITLPALPAVTFLDWVRIASRNPPTGLLGSGTLAGTLAWHPAPSLQTRSATDALPSTIVISTGAPERARGESNGAQWRNPQLLSQLQPAWSGELEFSGESIQTPGLGPDPIPLGDLLLRSTPQFAASSSSFDLLPVTILLGGHQPATLTGHFDAAGYTLRLTGTAIPARLLALGDAIPQLGDGLRQLLEPAPEPVISTGGEAAAEKPATRVIAITDSPPADPIHIDLTATRAWGRPQTWRQTAPPPHSTRPSQQD